MEGQNATIQLMNNSLNIVNGLIDRRNLAAQDPHKPTVSASASRSNLSQVNTDSIPYLKTPTLPASKSTYMVPPTLSIPKNHVPCRHYLIGQCSYGDVCRFSHTTWIYSLTKSTYSSLTYLQFYSSLLYIVLHSIQFSFLSSCLLSIFISLFYLSLLSLLIYTVLLSIFLSLSI